MHFKIEKKHHFEFKGFKTIIVSSLFSDLGKYFGLLKKRSLNNPYTYSFLTV